MADAMKLLPCPMCGGEAALLDYEARYGGLHYASRCPQCTSCGCSMGYLPTAKKAVEAWNCRASMPTPEKAPSFDDARRKLIHCIEQWDGETEYDAEDIAALADDILDVFASPPAREEAPAEGAGEIEGLRNRIKCLEKLAGEQSLRVMQEATRAKDAENELAALRNRTSEPEAGAVAWRARMRPNGEWMVLDAKYVPSRAAGSAVEVQPLFTHPAPATADKLLVAVEALEKIADEAPYRSGYCQSDIEYGPKLSDTEMQAEARQALAALNEQPQ